MHEAPPSSGSGKFFSLLLLLASIPLFLMVLWVFGLFACQPLTLLLLPPFLLFIAYGLRKEGFRIRTWTAAFCLAEFGIFCLLPGPSAERWPDLVQRTPRISMTDGSTLHIADIRDAVYRRAKDYDLRYLEEDFPLNEVVGVSLAELFRGDGSEDSTLMLSFEFKDGRYLTFAPIMRVPVGGEANFLGSHYKNNGLVYLFGTEEDFFLSATDMNHARLYLYPLAATPRQSAEMLALCAGMASDTNSKSTAYIPLRETYRSGILSILRHLCPALPARRPVANNDIARQLYLNGALQKRQSGDWSRIRRDFAVGNNIAQGDRDSYSDKLRKRIGAATRRTIPERKIQEEVETHPANAEKARPAATEKLSAADIPEPRARLQQDTRTSAADIPEPRARLEQDTRPHTTTEPPSNGAKEPEKADSPTDAPHADTPKENPAEQDAAAATRELNKQPQVADLPKKSAADRILEPGARMDADARREADEAAALEASRKRAEEGYDILDNHRKQDDNSRFSELFFGKKSGGIKIIEKAKPQEEPHPLDPHRKQKKKTPFDDEEQPQKPAEPQETDPFAKPAPIRI